MKNEKYKVELEIKGVLTLSRINQTFQLSEKEVFFSEEDTIIKGMLEDQSAMTSFIKKVRDSGIEIKEISCMKSDE